QFSVRCIEIFLPVVLIRILYYSITTGVERRRWDEPEALFRGLYNLIIIKNIKSYIIFLNILNKR
ncbi:MAG: hypothetical protein QOK90_10710, partial [Nitrososphaeraceae archaeon]|nr:hypothetical protein [Nitrososphaeraceae archaeon]